MLVVHVGWLGGPTTSWVWGWASCSLHSRTNHCPLLRPKPHFPQIMQPCNTLSVLGGENRLGLWGRIPHSWGSQAFTRLSLFLWEKLWSWGSLLALSYEGEEGSMGKGKLFLILINASTLGIFGPVGCWCLSPRLSGSLYFFENAFLSLWSSVWIVSFGVFSSLLTLFHLHCSVGD